VPRAEKPKRETHVQACARLAQELTQLAGSCETAFHEAAKSDFKLDDEDSRLIAEEHLARVALTQLDGACGELASFTNAPTAKFTTPPTKKDLDRLLQCCRERGEWLELMARYRFQTAQGSAAAP
jgi:hypothetical protein